MTIEISIPLMLILFSNISLLLASILIARPPYREIADMLEKYIANVFKQTVVNTHGNYNKIVLSYDLNNRTVMYAKSYGVSEALWLECCLKTAKRFLKKHKNDEVAKSGSSPT